MAAWKTGLLVVAGLLPIALGVIKIYLHLISPWRSGYLDYLVAAGLILGGIFLLAQPSLKAALLPGVTLITIELYKAIVDYPDHFDLFLTILATIYLSIPILKHILHDS